MTTEEVQAAKRSLNEIDGATELKKKRRIEDESVEKVVVTENDSKEEGLEEKSMGKSWYQALSKEFQMEYFAKLKLFLRREVEVLKKKILPPADDIYSWSRFCPLDQVKVVIIGQDPYHNIGQAHGLCFSVRKGVQPPPSLVNIFKELESDIPGFKIPSHGDLSSWAKQGVLLLNAVLTVEAHKANSHAGQGWEKFTDSVVQTVAKTRKNLVFMLWGNYAQKKASNINSRDHLLLKAVHPSPLSAHRGFFGCKHFSKANDYLKKNGHDIINWSDLNLPNA